MSAFCDMLYLSALAAVTGLTVGLSWAL